MLSIVLDEFRQSIISICRMKADEISDCPQLNMTADQNLIKAIRFMTKKTGTHAADP